jgi:hypothetical protein
MLRSIPARRAIRTLGSNSKWMESVARTRALSNRVKAAGGLMVEKKGTRGQATAAASPSATTYVPFLFANWGIICLGVYLSYLFMLMCEIGKREKVLARRSIAPQRRGMRGKSWWDRARNTGKWMNRTSTNNESRGKLRTKIGKDSSTDCGVDSLE